MSRRGQAIHRDHSNRDDSLQRPGSGLVASPARWEAPGITKGATSATLARNCAWNAESRFNPRGSARSRKALSKLQIGRQFSAMRCQFGHHLFVQPNIHGCGIVSVAGVAELLGKLLTRAQA